MVFEKVVAFEVGPNWQRATLSEILFQRQQKRLSTFEEQCLGRAWTTAFPRDAPSEEDVLDLIEWAKPTALSIAHPEGAAPDVVEASMREVLAEHSAEEYSEPYISMMNGIKLIKQNDALLKDSPLMALPSLEAWKKNRRRP